MDWKNNFEKKIQNKKTVKSNDQMPHVNKKPQPNKRNFVQTQFFHSTSKLEQKISRLKTACCFASHCFGVAKSSLQFNFKNHENIGTDLKT